MTVHDMLADGRLADAVAHQEAAVSAAPADPAARRLLVDLLAFAGRLDDARQHLAQIRTDEPDWAEVERGLHRLFRSERLRTFDGREPTVTPEPPAKHAERRRKAAQLVRRADPERAVRAVDAADAVSPVVRGFIDGREFDGLRDADDRFASVLEAFRGGEYLWVPWEALRKVRLAPPAALLDQLYRPAELTFRDGTSAAVHLPLVYPASHRADGDFALGVETDHVCPDGGPTRCVGGKLLLVNDDDELMLSECRLIEIR
ncbi:MAG: type VI secretion system accessory protein TagJ [Gemmata sp.]